MTIAGLWRYGDWRHVATGCTALVPFNNELTLHYLNVAGKQATQCLCDTRLYRCNVDLVWITIGSTGGQTAAIATINANEWLRAHDNRLVSYHLHAVIHLHNYMQTGVFLRDSFSLSVRLYRTHYDYGYRRFSVKLWGWLDFRDGPPKLGLWITRSNFSSKQQNQYIGYYC